MTETAVATSDLIAVAHGLADQVLFPTALDTDKDQEIPVRQLQALADAGLYGVSTSGDRSLIPQYLEILAGGCLTTAFIWAQHLGAAAAAQAATGAVHDRWAAALSSGAARAGVAFAHMLRPGEPLATMTPARDGWEMTGVAPWVTGWGHIDVVHAAARHGDDIVWGLVDAVEGESLKAQRLELATVNASSTVVLTFDKHPVPNERITSIENYETWRARYQLGLRANGSLPLGVASRCCRLLETPSLDTRLIEVRSALDTASIDEMPAARADAALFAVQSATALVAATGGRAVTMSEHAQRLLREAMFLMVQGQTPAIKAEMLDRLTAG